MLGHTLRVFLASAAVVIASCAQETTGQDEAITVKVSPDAQTCTIDSQELPCIDLPAHLADALKVARSRSIVLSDTVTGRTDDALSALADTLHRVGYTSVIVVGFDSEPG